MEKPYRILQVFGIMNRGGAETMIMNLYRNIDRNKIQFDFVVHHNEPGDYDDEIKKLGGRIFYVPRYSLFNHISYKMAWKTLIKEHEEWGIIHGHMYSTASIYLKVAKKLGRYTIAHSHSTSNGRGVLALLKNLMQIPLKNIADKLMACSDEAGKWLYGKDVLNSKKYILLPNAINVDKFIFNKETREKVRKNLKLENKIVIGHVGRFEYAKNFSFILDLINNIGNLNKNFVFIQIGNGKGNEQLEDMISKKNLGNNIKLMGIRNDVYDLIQAMDIFILPSIYEGLPVVVIEAQASGLPCLLSNSITKEVGLTNLVKYLPIDKGIDIWSKEILSLNIEDDRLNTGDIIKNAGYDVKTSAKWIEKFYISINKDRI